MHFLRPASRSLNFGGSHILFSNLKPINCSSISRRSCRTLNTSSAQPVSSKTGLSIYSRSLIRVLRAARVVGLTIAVYQAGYQSGLINYAQDPQKTDEQLLRGVLTSTGAKSYNKGGNTVSYQRVDRVASRIVEAAKQLCDDNVTEETERLKNKENLVRSLSSRLLDFETKIFKASSIERAELSKLAMQLKIDLAAAHGEVAEATELVARWKSASQKLKGSWNYILTDAKSVNAFVTDLFPRRIFVHIGLIEKVDPTDDELGLILGHEISHLILGHVEETTNITTILLISQLVILSFIDPIGYLSMFADSMVATVGSYITNSFSRNTEEDADALGIAIAAMACFDTKKGANVFLKLGILEGNMAGITQWNSSHPSTQGRYHRMLEYSDKYQRSPDCVTYLEAMKKLSTILAIPPWMNRS